MPRRKDTLVRIIFYVLLYLNCTTMLLASTSSNAIDISSSHHNIGKHISIYKDPTASMKLSDIRKLPKEIFKPLNKPASSHGFTDASIWYRFNVINHKKTPVSRLFVFTPAWLDHVNIAVISPSGEVKKYQGGNALPYKHRTLDHYLINFKHAFEAGESQVYIEVKTRDPFIIAISLMEESTFLSEQLFDSLIIGLIYGGIIALLIYNLFLYFRIKEKYYLFYVIYLIAFLLLNSSYNGYWYMSITSNYPEIQNWSHSILAYIFICAALLFANSFLNLKKYHQKLYRSTLYLIYTILTISLFSAVFGGYHYHVMFSILSIIVASSYIVIVALYSWKSGMHSARYFLFGSLSGLIGACVTALTLMSLIPYNYFTYKASDFGMYIDIILLSLALADKYKIIQEARLKAEKDSKTDVLTGLKNRRFFYEICAQESKKLKRYKNDFSIILLDIDNFKQVNDTYGHSMGDLLLKQIAFSITDTIRVDDTVFRLGGDEFIILLPKTKEEDAYTLAKHLLVKINSIYVKERETRCITASMGISSFQADDKDIHDTIKRADSALYQVKFADKNDIKIWTNENKGT